MRVFKFKTFIKWAKKQGMSDDDLKKAIAEIQIGLILDVPVFLTD